MLLLRANAGCLGHQILPALSVRFSTDAVPLPTLSPRLARAGRNARERRPGNEPTPCVTPPSATTATPKGRGQDIADAARASTARRPERSLRAAFSSQTQFVQLWTKTTGYVQERMRFTKIVATIGPASREPDVLERMIRAGVDVVRLNFA